MEKLIMTPGPTEVNERVRLALAAPLINPDLDDQFLAFYDSLTRKVQKLLHTDNQTLIIGGEGILGLEAACTSLIERGDRVLCLNNGIYGEGFADFVRLYGGEAVFFQQSSKVPFVADDLRSFLEEDSNFKLATLVHCETPTGLVNPIDAICPVLKEFGITTVVDAVASIAGYVIEPDKWGIDVLLGASQKCLSAPPGLTFMSISQQAWHLMENRTQIIPGYYANLTLWRDWLAKKHFPYTQPVSDLYGFEAAVDIVLEEGLAESAKRHATLASRVRKTLQTVGLEIFPEGAGASNTVTAIVVPDELDDVKFRNHLWNEYNVMIAGSWGEYAGKIWRIGHMGENCQDAKIYRTFAAMDNTFRHFGYRTNKPLAWAYVADNN